MPYTLHRLSAGSYDLLLRGKIIGSVVRNFPSLGTSEDGVLSSSRSAFPAQRPKPFTKSGHAFRSLNAAWECLDTPPIVAEDFRPPRAQHRRAVDKRIKSPADAHFYGRNTPE